MPQRIIKNYTDTDIIIGDLGSVIIPANGALDVGGNESRLLELATSDDLLAVISRGIHSVQVNDGTRDLSFSEGIDTIRKIQRPTSIDRFGRWVVRADSRRYEYETVFSGSGDDLNTRRIGDGTPFKWDFSDGTSEFLPEENYHRYLTQWNFIDGVYLKEGTMYFFNAPKGSFANFYLVVPAGYPYNHKSFDMITSDVSSTIRIADKDVVVNRWLVNFWMEGDAPMGDELNTEAASEFIAPEYIRYISEIKVPNVQGWQDFHGHFNLEIYRPLSSNFD